MISQYLFWILYIIMIAHKSYKLNDVSGTTKIEVHLNFQIKTPWPKLSIISIKKKNNQFYKIL